MHKQHITTISATTFVAILAIGCSRSPSHQPSSATQVPANITMSTELSTNMATVDLGAIELTPNTPKRLSLGVGKEGIFTGTQLSDGNITVKLVAEAPDHSKQFGEGAVTARPGQGVAIGVGGVMVAFAPTLKTQK